ncbi:MAG TPA: VOC family protein [Acidimicrobiia bacterium]|nr:VOC family protein [Acidimicrobiia bacterium]
MAVDRSVGPRFVGVAHVRINVRDLPRSIAWYRDVLGFEDPWFTGRPGVAVLFHPESKVEFILRQGQPASPAEAAFDHVALLVEDTDQLRAWERRLGELGLDLRITPAVGGVSINLEDPDGNDLELFVYDPPRA